MGSLIQLMGDAGVNVSYVSSIRGVFLGGGVASVDEHLGENHRFLYTKTPNQKSSPD